MTDDRGRYRVMTVCTGNICRSPMAEVVLRARLDEAGLGDRVVVDSTGVSDEEHGNPIDRRARAALAARGYPVPDRAARQVRASDLRERDLVLAMTASHARALRRIARDDEAASRVVMFRTFDPAAPRVADVRDEHLLDVDDPWYGGPENFETCLDEIEAAADGVVDAVRAGLDGRDAATV
ncbi:putative low molecular weight protein-tyrosine-phosphatase [Cellulomonas hominis]|nr:putative low molecular weight protein-tyrosine-phosphatase [Cellulomonas hominis]